MVVVVPGADVSSFPYFFSLVIIARVTLHTFRTNKKVLNGCYISYVSYLFFFFFFFLFFSFN